MLTLGERLLQQLRDNGSLHREKLTDREIQRLDSFVSQNKVERQGDHYFPVGKDPAVAHEERTEKWWQDYWDNYPYNRI